jgi:hypothetical protein
MKVVIIIPIYKSSLSLDEKASYLQCLSILYKHTIALVTFEELDCSEYYTLAESKNVHIEKYLFNKSYFESTNGYNRLCKSYSFYNTFSSFDYMLIYQLDAWVFTDNLISWCQKNYDYIGAPWFEDFGKHEENKPLWLVGNGGFSLRKIDYFIKILSWRGPVMRCNIWKNFSLRKLLYALGHHNTMPDYTKSGLNEDMFFSIYMRQSWFPPRIPTCREAAFFSMEKSPAFLYQLIGQLPFGCHAYKKFDFDIFWHRYIPDNNPD